MISSLRNFMQTWIFKGVFLLLVLAFALWGAGEVGTNLFFTNSVAKIDGTVIDYNDFNREVNTAAERMRLESLTSRELADLGIAEIILDQIITREALKNEADKLALVATDNTIRRALSRIQGVVNEKGEIDTVAVKNYLYQQGITEDQFLQEVSDEYRSNLLPSAVSQTRSQFKGLARVLSIFERQTLDIEYVEVKTKPNNDTPSEDELNQVLLENAQKYQVPETRSISLLTVSADSYFKNQPLTDEDLQKEYESQKVVLLTPERRNITLQRFQDEASAKDALTKGFGEESVSQKDVAKDKIPDPLLAKNIFDITEVDSIKIVEGGIGWYLIRIDSIAPAFLPSLADVKEDITERAAKNKALDAVYEAISKIENGLSTKQPLDDLAANVGLEAMLFEDFTTTSSFGIDELSPTEENIIIESAFNIPANLAKNEGGVIELPQEKFAIFQVKNVTALSIPDLETIKPALTKDWQKMQSVKTANEDAVKIMEENFAGATVKTLNDLPRTNKDETNENYPLPGEILKEARKLKSAGDVITVSANDGTAYALRLKDVTFPTSTVSADFNEITKQNEEYIKNQDRSQSNLSLRLLIENSQNIERNADKIAESLGL